MFIAPPNAASRSCRAPVAQPANKKRETIFVVSRGLTRLRSGRRYPRADSLGYTVRGYVGTAIVCGVETGLSRVDGPAEM